MIIKTIKKIIKIPYIKYLNWKLSILYNRKYENKNILGKKYKVRKGSIRSTNDYDDAWLLFLSSKSDVVFDIGCNIGQSSLLISHSESLRKLVLVEPNPLSLSIAAENLITNNKSANVIFIPKAAFNKSGENIQLWTMPGAFAGASFNRSFSETATITNSFIEVKTITLDEIAQTYNLYPDLVKIDVEGAEYFVLEGSKEIAIKKKTIFIVEVHSSDELNIIDNTDKILQWTKQNNYKAYYLCEHKELLHSQYVENRGRYHLLLIHKEKKYPEGLNNIKQASNIEEINFDINK